jgi:hypothetical protein
VTSEPRSPLQGAATEPLGEVMNRALGGPLGIAESTVPAAAFVIVLTASGQDITLAAVVAVGLALVLTIARVVRRQSPVYALAGVAGVAVAGYVAQRTGRAEDFFLPGLLINIAYAGIYLVSILVGRPLIGLIVAGLSGGGDGSWHRDPVRRRAYARASWVWVGLFLLRIAVQLPLYLAGAVVALGVARVAMGLPLFAVGIWLSWLLLRDTQVTSRPRAAAT